MEGGPPCFPQGFTCPAVLWIQSHSLLFHLRDSHPLWWAFPDPSVRYLLLNDCPQPRRIDPPVWPLPRSLATTCGISVDVSSSPYLDVSVQAVPFLRLFCSTQDDWILSSRVAPFGYPRINGYLLLPEAFRSLSRPSSAPDAKAFPLRSFQLDLSLFSQRLVREFLVLFENYAGFTKIEIVCHPASFRMLFHNQFVSSVSPQRNLSVALLAFVTLFSFQGADRRPQAFACLRHSFQPLLQSDLKIRSFDQVFKSKGKSPGGPEWARTTDLTIISRTL